MQTEKREITHISIDKYFKWFYQRNIKDVEFEIIDKKTVKLSTDLITDEIFTKTAIWRVFLYKDLFVFLIACLFLVELDFSFDLRSSDNNITFIVGVATIFNAFLISRITYINFDIRHLEKKILILILILIDAYIFYQFDIYIEFMMSFPLAICIYFVNIIVKDITERNWKNTYFSKSLKTSFCYKDKEASYIQTILISLQIVTLMLLVVQK